MILLLALLLLSERARALVVHGREVRLLTLDQSTARRRSLSVEQRLWIVHTVVAPPPDSVHGWLGNDTYVVHSATLAEFTGQYARLEPEHKYPRRINTASRFPFGVLVKCVDSSRGVRHLPYHVTTHQLSKSYMAVVADDLKGVSPEDLLSVVARSTNVVWMSAMPAVRHRHTVFISDTGLDVSHCFFYSATPTSYGVIYLNGSYPVFANSSARVRGVMAVETAPGVFTDYQGADGAHGTSTSGLINGGQCVDPMSVTRQGFTQNASLLFMDISPNNGERGAERLTIPSDFTSAFTAAAANGAAVHSASWGSTCADGDYDGTAYQFDELSRSLDLLHVVAAGNDGAYGSSCGGYLVTTPATAKNAISVGALESPDHVTSFTSQGPLPGGGRAPILLAQGVNVPVAYGFYVPEANHSDFNVSSGTSFAAPVIAAMAIQIDASLGKRTRAATKTAFLVASAVPSLGVFTFGVPAAGRVDLSFGTPSLTQLLNATTLRENQTSGERWTFCFTAQPGTGSAAIAWLDLPSYPGTGRALVNDLDLVLVVGNRTTLIADTVFDTMERLAFTVPDNTTLVRAIVIPAGTVHSAPQLFSMAIVGFTGVTPVPCLGSCYSEDDAACVVSFGYGIQLCDANGTSTCYPNSCTSPHAFAADGTCTLTGTTACSLTHGSGVMVSSVCTMQTCDTNYHFLNQTACVCDPVGRCSDGRRVACDESCDSTAAPVLSSHDHFQFATRSVSQADFIATTVIMSLVAAGIVALSIYFVYQECKLQDNRKVGKQG